MARAYGDAAAAPAGGGAGAASSTSVRCSQATRLGFNPSKRVLRFVANKAELSAPLVKKGWGTASAEVPTSADGEEREGAAEAVEEDREEEDKWKDVVAIEGMAVSGGEMVVRSAVCVTADGWVSKAAVPTSCCCFWCRLPV